MDTLQRMFEETVDRELSPERLLARFIARKARSMGVELTEAEIKRLESAARHSDFGDLSIDVPNESAKALLERNPNLRDSTVNLDLGNEAELEGFREEVIKKFMSAMPGLVEQTVQSMLASMKRRARKQLRLLQGDRSTFRARGLRAWKKPLGLLELYISIASEIGSDLYADLGKEPPEGKTALCEALARLHARASQVSLEVHCLLESGYADGAHARWRCLHELVVTAEVLIKHGEEISARYLAYKDIESYNAALEFQRHCAALDLEPLTPEELGILKDTRDSLVLKYGVAYGKMRGWAADALKREKPTFQALEEAAGWDFFRPFYRMASQNVHADPTGVFLRLGLPADSEHFLLAGPSNIGLSDPAMGTARSLLALTALLLALKPNVDSAVAARVLEAFLGELEEAFIAAERSFGQG